MNTMDVKKNWNVQIGRLKQKFASLTDNHQMLDEGKKEEMHEYDLIKCLYKRNRLTGFPL